MLTTVIVDDEPKAIDLLKMYVTKSNMLDCLATFRSPLSALEYLQKNKIDLLFLDINMPNLDGISFLKLLTNKPQIVLTTAYSEYAVESYELDVLDYLVKPITFERFMKSVLKAKKSHSDNGLEINNKQKTNTREAEHVIYLKSGKTFHKVDYHEVLFLEKTGNYIVYHILGGKKILVRENMKDLGELPSFFVQVHKSFIASLLHIDELETTSVKLKNKEVLPVGKVYRDALFQRFTS